MAAPTAEQVLAETVAEVQQEKAQIERIENGLTALGTQVSELSQQFALFLSLHTPPIAAPASGAAAAAEEPVHSVGGMVAAPRHLKVTASSYPVLTQDKSGKLNYVLDTWFMDMEGCFRLDGVSIDADKINVATRVAMTGPVREACLNAEVAARRGDPGAVWPSTWEGFQTYMKENFAETDRVKAARQQLHELSQQTCGGDVDAFVAKSRQLHVVAGPKLSESEKYHYFMSGLDPALATGLALAVSAAEAAGTAIPETFAMASKMALKASFSRKQAAAIAANDGSYSTQTVQKPPAASAESKDAGEPSTAAAVNPAPMELSAMYRAQPQGKGDKKPPKLPAKLRRKLIAEGRCLICHETDHGWRSCPFDKE